MSPTGAFAELRWQQTVCMKRSPPRLLHHRRVRSAFFPASANSNDVGDPDAHSAVGHLPKALKHQLVGRGSGEIRGLSCRKCRRFQGRRRLSGASKLLIARRQCRPAASSSIESRKNCACLAWTDVDPRNHCRILRIDVYQASYCHRMSASRTCVRILPGQAMRL